ncbi:MAG: DUF2927 domain-containing protein [Pseudomonadota bacterium]
MRKSAAVFALLGLVACDIGQTTSSLPRARPDTLVQPSIQPTSEESAALRRYLTQVQSAQLSQGLLRNDGGGPDTPFSADTLAENFEEIVFFNEYASALQGRGGESPLRRWEKSVRVDIVFGDSVPDSQRRSDTGKVRSFVDRLRRITGHPVTNSANPNFFVVVAGEDDRDAALAKVARRSTAITEASLAPLRELNRDTYCVVAAYASRQNRNTYSAAVALIRSENPPLLRESCVHEELAQGLGLANDSRDARPSIFNDDDEFALLTDHDEMLLKMLYDPRLEPGMTASEAAPVTRIIARELTTNGPL